MGKFGCTCGNAIPLNSIPEFCEAVLITDIALDNVAGDPIEADRMPKRFVYECDACGRLWIQTEPGSDEFISFVPEGERLRFRDDYGKGFQPEPREEGVDFEPDVFEVRERYAAVTMKAAIKAGYRGFVATNPLDHPFKVERALVPDSTPNEILMHSPALLQPTPLNLVLSQESGRLGLQRALFKPMYEKGEKIEFEVENTLDRDFVVTIAVMGRMAAADVPPAVPGRH